MKRRISPPFGGTEVTRLSWMIKSRHTLEQHRQAAEARELALFIDITWLAAKTPAIRTKGLDPFAHRRLRLD
jgi:hypothetical protein